MCSTFKGNHSQTLNQNNNEKSDTWDVRSSSTTDMVGKVCLSCLLWVVDGCLRPITPLSVHRMSSREERRQTSHQHFLKHCSALAVRGKIQNINPLQVCVCVHVHTSLYPLSLVQCYSDTRSANPDTETGILTGWGSLWEEWLCAGLSPGTSQV